MTKDGGENTACPAKLADVRHEIALLVFLFSLLAQWAQQPIVTGPMVFTTAGILAFFAPPVANPQDIANPLVLMMGMIYLEKQTTLGVKRRRGIPMPAVAVHLPHNHGGPA